MQLNWSNWVSKKNSVTFKSNLDSEAERIQNHKLLCSQIQQFQFCSRSVVLLSVLVPVMKFSSQYNRTLSWKLGPNDVDYVDYSCHFLLSITPLCSHWIHSCFHKQSVSGCCRNITLPPYLFLTNSIRIEQSSTKYNWQIARRSTMVQMPWTFLGNLVFFLQTWLF